MIAPKKPLTQRAAEIDIALSVADAPKPDEPIKSKKPRLRGRARADAAKVIAPPIEGPKSRRPPTLSAGTVLTRQYKGKRITVKVLGDRQFEYAGEIFRSLSAVANHITQSHVSGNAWFGIAKSKKEAAR